MTDSQNDGIIDKVKPPPPTPPTQPHTYAKPYKPYLTLWDKISQNFADLEGNSHKKFKSHRIFRPFYNKFYEEININDTLSWFSQASYMKKKDFKL